MFASSTGAVGGETVASVAGFVGGGDTAVASEAAAVPKSWVEDAVGFCFSATGSVTGSATTNGGWVVPQ